MLWTQFTNVDGGPLIAPWIPPVVRAFGTYGLSHGTVFEVRKYFSMYRYPIYERALFYGRFPGFSFRPPSNGHVMHQQFNIQQLYALPTLYLCVLLLSENKKRLVPLTS